MTHKRPIHAARTQYGLGMSENERPTRLFRFPPYALTCRRRPA